MYCRVPRNSPVCVKPVVCCSSGVAALAMPKSMTFTRGRSIRGLLRACSAGAVCVAEVRLVVADEVLLPLGGSPATRMLPGLRSRCTMP